MIKILNGILYISMSKRILYFCYYNIFLFFASFIIFY